MTKKVIAAFLLMLFSRGLAGQHSNVTCDTQFSDLVHSITVVLCPAGCWRQKSPLCGNRVYTRGPICLAAMQDQWIADDGGPVTVYRRPSQENNFYSGGLRNGVKSQSCSASGDTFSFEMTCATQGYSSQEITEVECPSGCGKDPVFGSDIYSSHSSLCSAAIHAGLITVKGGVLKFYMQKSQSSYTGSTNNGLTSKSASFSDAAFTFERLSCPGNSCTTGSTCMELVGDYVCICPPGYYGKFCELEFTECWNGNLSGLYSYKSGLQVICSNGWTVFQRRFDGSVDFQQNWIEYKNGFGCLDGEFWWGLEHVFQTVRSFTCTQCRIRVEIGDFNGNSGYAEYSNFHLNGESDKYRICVHGYSGNIGNSFNPSGHPSFLTNHFKFSTQDQDNDNSYGFCASSQRKQGGWWFRNCSWAVLNGFWTKIYSEDHESYAHWKSFHGRTPLKNTELKFRCG